MNKKLMPTAIRFKRNNQTAGYPGGKKMFYPPNRLGFSYAEFSQLEKPPEWKDSGFSAGIEPEIDVLQQPISEAEKRKRIRDNLTGKVYMTNISDASSIDKSGVLTVIRPELIPLETWNKIGSLNRIILTAIAQGLPLTERLQEQLTTIDPELRVLALKSGMEQHESLRPKIGIGGFVIAAVAGALVVKLLSRK